MANESSSSALGCYVSSVTTVTVRCQPAQHSLRSPRLASWGGLSSQKPTTFGLAAWHNELPAINCVQSEHADTPFCMSTRTHPILHAMPARGTSAAPHIASHMHPVHLF